MDFPRDLSPFSFNLFANLDAYNNDRDFSTQPPTASNTISRTSGREYTEEDDVQHEWGYLTADREAQLNTPFNHPSLYPSAYQDITATIDPRLLTMDPGDQQPRSLLQIMNDPYSAAVNGSQYSTAMTNTQHIPSGPSYSAPSHANTSFSPLPRAQMQPSGLDALADVASNSPRLATSGSLPPAVGTGSNPSAYQGPYTAHAVPSAPAAPAAVQPQPAAQVAVVPAAPPAIPAPAPLIPDVVFANALGRPYDRRWMINNGIPNNIVTNFNDAGTSKMKLDYLVRNDVIVIGDRFRVVMINGRNRRTREGIVVDKKLGIRFPAAQAGTIGSVHKCTGPSPFISAMMNEFAGDVVGSGWRAVRLITANGQDLGTLSEIRQWWHIWVEEQEKWGRRVGAPTRRRRAGGGARPSLQQRRR